jgi:hypothetical protein
VFAIATTPADAATLGHPALGQASIFTSILGHLGGAVLGAFKWTIGLASKFILVTLSAFVRMLIPRSWAHEAVSVFDWIVAIPDYAGSVTSPGGGHHYGFAGVNDLRSLFEWIGLAVLPLTLVTATGRAMLGHGDHVAAPVARVVILALALLSYTWWWAQAAAVINQLTNLILSPAAVTDGIHQLMAYATEGVALGGWQLIDLGLMATLAVELLMLIAVKVVILLVGALLYATGPVMLGVVPSESGAVLARAWLSSVMTLFALPAVWATIFAVGAVLIGDASTAGPLIGGNTGAGQLLGGVIVAVAGAATLWLCLRAAREVGGLLRIQLGGMLVTARSATNLQTRPAPAQSVAGSRGAESLRTFQGRVRDASASALSAGGPAGQRTAQVAGAATRFGQRGLLLGGAHAANGLVRGAGRAVNATAATPAGPSQTAPGDGATAGPQPQRVGRAGAVASRMARAGSASWQQSRPAGERHGDTPATTPRGARHTTGSTSQGKRPADGAERPTRSSPIGKPHGAHNTETQPAGGRSSRPDDGAVDALQPDTRRPSPGTTPPTATAGGQRRAGPPSTRAAQGPSPAPPPHESTSSSTPPHPAGADHGTARPDSAGAGSPTPPPSSDAARASRSGRGTTSRRRVPPVSREAGSPPIEPRPAVDVPERPRPGQER